MEIRRIVKIHNSRIVKTTNQELPESQFKNGENHNSGIVKTTNQEFPESQFKNDENHTSRIVEITTQEVPKSQSNNTDINNTDFNETDSIQSYLSPSAGEVRPVGEDVIERMETYRALIQENIDYECFWTEGRKKMWTSLLS